MNINNRFIKILYWSLPYPVIFICCDTELQNIYIVQIHN
jgi:hypothetical protein